MRARSAWVAAALAAAAAATHCAALWLLPPTLLALCGGSAGLLRLALGG